LKRIEHIDNIGRKFLVALPDDETNSERGMIIGPPLLDELGLPKKTMVALHNELYRRKIFTFNDARARREEIGAALITVFKSSAEKIVAIYSEGAN
jgi:hypothetical protein